MHWAAREMPRQTKATVMSESDDCPTSSIVQGASQLRDFYGSNGGKLPPKRGDNFAAVPDDRLVRDLAAFFGQFDDSPVASDWERAAEAVKRYDADRVRDARRRRELAKFGVIDGGLD
jgi:hypothetical protein